MTQALPARREKINRLLPTILIILLCLQPVLDILSYWQDALNIPFSLSFVPRTLVLVLLGVGGFLLSERKRVYFIACGVIALFYAAHLYVCYQTGIASLTTDVSNFIRVLQLPVTTLCLITCLRRNKDDCFEALQRGIVLSMLILAVSFAVSVLTKTEPFTYPDRNVGVRGYSFWPNAQSAILSLAAPISIGYSIRKKPDKPLLPIATMVLSLALLYVHGTRLSFLCMMITSAGMALVVLLVKGTPKKYAWILLALTVVGGCAYRFSPMYINRQNVTAYTQVKTSVSERLQELAEVQIENGTSPAIKDVVKTPTGLQAFALKAPMQKCSFSDIEGDYEEKFGPYLAYAQSLALLSGGDSEYNYMPDNEMSIAEVMAVAVNIYERYYGVKAMPDYTGDSWYDAYVKRAVSYGLLGEDVTDAEEHMTRQQAAQLVYKLLPQSEFPQTCDVTKMTDTTDAAVLALCRAGIVQDNAFRPTHNVSRGELAVMLVRAVNPAMRLCDEGYTRMTVEPFTPDLSGVSDELRKDASLYTLYQYYLGGLVDRFGIHTVLEQYGYTTDTTTIISERNWKLQYCYLLMDESGPMARLFGLEVTKMIYKGTSYDVENDFHGIYLLYGWVGLGLMLLFIGYFLFLIVRVMLKNPKRYFTLDAGAFGIALITCLIHACFTCGVLRRANTLFYMAALLAGVYYLTMLKEYEERS